MTLTKQQMSILANLASSPRTLNFFTHDRETPVFKLTLTKLVHLGYVYQDDGDKYYITTKGRQAYDAPGASVKRSISDWRKTVYQTGDGDIITQKRPGSMDAYNLPSGGY
jgi:hypothetical protein